MSKISTWEQWLKDAIELVWRKWENEKIYGTPTALIEKCHKAGFHTTCQSINKV